MELMAGIKALEALPEGAAVAFYADSKYLQNAFVKRWLVSWKKRGWRTSTDSSSPLQSSVDVTSESYSHASMH